MLFMTDTLNFCIVWWYLWGKVPLISGYERSQGKNWRIAFMEHTIKGQSKNYLKMESEKTI